MSIPKTQHAIQFTAANTVVHNESKPVDAVGPHQMMLQVEACGICFSDTKLLKAFDAHPRKAEVTSGIGPDALDEIPGYKPGDASTVPGHEPVGRIVEVGEKVTHFKEGDRVLVQADWKHLRTPESNGAFGHNFEGALQEYVVIDERCVVSSSGEEFLIQVSDGPTAAAVGLIEPWATVEGSYAWPERNHVVPGGRLLVVSDSANDGLETLIKENSPGEIITITSDAIAAMEGQVFDDVVYYGADADVVEGLAGVLGTRGVLCIVLGGRTFERRVAIDVGRIHYDFIRFCGTTGDDPHEGYAWIPATGELREDDRVLIMGAPGPMGQMHTMRALTSGVTGISVACTGRNEERLAHLSELVQPMADANGVELSTINVSTSTLEHGYTHISCMVPDVALLAEAVDIAGDDAIVNAFAGIPSGTTGDFDLQRIIEGRIFILGTSGSDISDMRTVLDKIEKGIIDTHVSLDAVTGMAGVQDALDAVMNRTAGGKIMVYPTLHDLPLTRLADMAESLPHVAEHLEGGIWTKAAEKALLLEGN